MTTSPTTGGRGRGWHALARVMSGVYPLAVRVFKWDGRCFSARVGALGVVLAPARALQAQLPRAAASVQRRSLPQPWRARAQQGLLTRPAVCAPRLHFGESGSITHNRLGMSLHLRPLPLAEFRVQSLFRPNTANQLSGRSETCCGAGCGGPRAGLLCLGSNKL